MRKVGIKKINYFERAVRTVNTNNSLLASLWNRCNYGSVIAAFALYKLLEKQEKNPVFLNNYLKNNFAAKYVPADFIYKNCNVLSREIALEELNKASLYVAGPDIVWSSDINSKNHSDFFGENLDENVKKVSLAASFGKVNGNFASKSEQLQMKKALNEFKGISVRNKYDVGVCEQLFGAQADIILDPIFLCDIKDYEAIVNSRAYDKKEPYIFTYVEDGNNRIHRYVEEGIRIKNMPVKVYADIGSLDKSSAKLGFDTENDLTMEAWLSGLYNCSYVVTDSYYCACLAILFNKPFSIITSGDFKNKDEIKELLSWFELEERMVPCDEYSDMKDYMYLFRKPVNYNRVNRRLEDLKMESLNWIKDKV